MGLVGRVVVATGLFGIGSACAVAAVAVHGWWWGLALGLAGGLAAVLTLPPRWWGRLAFAAGWVLTVGYLTVPRPEGDYVLASNAAGYAFLGGTLVVMLVSIVTMRAGPDGSEPRRRDA